MAETDKSELEIYIDQAGLAIVEMDMYLSILRANEIFLELSGYPLNEVKGKNWHDFISHDYPSSSIFSNKTMSNDEGVPSDKFWCRLKDKNGNRKLISATISCNEKKGIYRASLYDISPQVTSERFTFDGGILFSELEIFLNGLFGYHDTNGIIQYANRELCRLVGLKKREVIGKHISKFFESDMCDMWLDLIKKRPDKIPGSIEFDSLGDSEKKYHVFASPKLMFDSMKRIVGVVFIVSDITELKQTEKMLRISDEKYSKAFHASQAISSISTVAEGRYIDVNQSFCEFVGHPKEDVIGGTSLDIHFFVAHDERDDFIQELKKQRAMRGFETRVFSKVKGVRTISLSAEIIELQGEECIIWVGYDITDQIRLEKEVLSITERERYRIGQYLHDDLGQHLAGISAMTKLLENRLKYEKSKEIKLVEDINGYIYEAIEKARRTARGLCPVRLEEDGLSAAMDDLVDKFKKMYGVQCEFYNLNRKLQIYNSNVAINLYYLVQEAMNNSVKHGEAEKIIITFSADKSYIYLSVMDDGKGFDEREQKSGTGMGISLMKYRSRAIGAKFEVRSAPGKGARVVCKLPRVSNTKLEWDWKHKLFDDLEPENF